MKASHTAESPLSLAQLLEHKVRTKTARTAVIGLGYVGYPLAVEICRAGYDVTAIDKSADRVRSIQEGKFFLGDIGQEAFGLRALGGRIKATTDNAALAHCDTVSICVPTPLSKTKDPDMSFIVAAAGQVVAHLHTGMLIILESTTYPGTTEELVLPMLERSGLKAGKDFFVCFSPERVDPGNARYQTRNIPKVIGGVTPRCTQLGCLFYSQVMEQVVPVSSTRVAEMAKLMENTFRMINIGLANEMALMCHRMGIDVWEVIEAAATKPFGFMPFFPGPGLGGHCIPVDPHYLSWKTKQAGHEPRFIELAAQINGSMPQYVVGRIRDALNDKEKPVKGSPIHIVGVAYKRNVADVRESPALDIIALLIKMGAIVTYTDPFVPRLETESFVLTSQPLEAAASAECVAIVTDHSKINYQRLVEISALILDTRNSLKGFCSPTILRL